MAKSKRKIYSNIQFDKIIGGGQALGELENGKKIMVWGVLPGEIATVQETKRKSKFSEGVATEIHKTSPERVKPQDPDSYLSTSPWQILDFAAENRYKADLINQAFELHGIQLNQPISIKTDNQIYGYRNKIEFSFWWDNDKNQLDLAFFRRGTKGKIPVQKTSLATDEINQAGQAVIEILRRRQIEAYDLKTVLIRSNRQKQVAVQLYVKDENFEPLTDQELQTIPNLINFELFFSNPKSPASVITKRLQTQNPGAVLTDQLLDTEFKYSTEGFFQINLPVYELALNDIKNFIDKIKPHSVVDLYAGVGSIGLTVAKNNLTLVEINQSAVQEMKNNIKNLARQNTKAILAPAEQALEYINSESLIILDPPRAGLHDDVVQKLLQEQPEFVVYLSCNPVTQARDVQKLIDQKQYFIIKNQGYNFFPRTPHIENLVILQKK